MSYCLNPDCQKPNNTEAAKFCQNCGGKLLLKDRYRALQILGRGGFGRTFLAVDEDKPSRPYCVIKQFFPNIQNGKALVKAATLFEQEAMRLEELGHHPQIPELLAHFSQEQRQYLIQEFIEGKNLLQCLQTQVFREAEIQTLLHQLLPVLEFIHAHRVIHRDIKPENLIARVQKPATKIPWLGLLQLLAAESEKGFKDSPIAQSRFSELITREWGDPPADATIIDLRQWRQMASQLAQYSQLSFSQRQFVVSDAYRFLQELRQRSEQQQSANPIEEQLVLVDFGAAKRTTSTGLMRTGTTIGSPEYVAPEQTRGKATFASDLYSLGVTCLHLLTGVSPFDLFDTAQDQWVWRRYLANNPVSEALAQVLDKLVEQATSRRYQSATEVLQHLQHLKKSPAAIAVALPLPQAVQMARPIGLGKPAPKPSFTLSQRPPETVKSKLKPPAPRSSLVPVPQTKKHPARAKAQSWRCVQRLSGLGKVQAIALTADGKFLAGSSGNAIHVWELPTGQPLRKLVGHFDVVQTIALSPRGSLLASGSFDKTIRLWHLQTGQRLGVLALHTDTVLAIAFSPDGKTAASSSLHDAIKLWDVETGQEMMTLAGHTGRVESLVFSADSKTLLSGSADTTLKLWDLETQSELRTLSGHTQLVSAVVLSPDGKTIASSSWDGTIKLWSWSTRKEKRMLTGHLGRVGTCAFSPDSKILVSGGDTVKFWNARSGKELETLVGHGGLVSAIAFSADGQTLVTGSWDGTIAIWEN
jgi:serine/threonine protein kinase